MIDHWFLKCCSLEKKEKIITCRNSSTAPRHPRVIPLSSVTHTSRRHARVCTPTPVQSSVSWFISERAESVSMSENWPWRNSGARCSEPPTFTRWESRAGQGGPARGVPRRQGRAQSASWLSGKELGPTARRGGWLLSGDQGDGRDRLRPSSSPNLRAVY